MLRPRPPGRVPRSPRKGSGPLALTCHLCMALLLLAACAAPPTLPSRSPASPAGPGAAEQPVRSIPLAGPLAGERAEVSGLAWYGDALLILPQYPDFAGDGEEGDGSLYALAKTDILAYLDGTTPGPLEPRPVPFSAPGLGRQIDGFQGYEAIAVAADRVYLTIEAQTKQGMHGYLVAGSIEPGLAAVRLDPGTVVAVEPQGSLGNKSDEALVMLDDRLLSLYEVNGAGLNAEPVAHAWSLDLAPLGSVPFPHVEYRITDATPPDAGGRFWAINYFFRCEPELASASDPLADGYGRGATHIAHSHVERLIELQYTSSGIVLSGTPPIQLELLPDARNWEGLARLDGQGFLLMTDKFPGTILGFVRQ